MLAIIEFTDLIFAVDSLPAVFGVTREPFLVFSATALALLGLRSMYFLLAGMRDRFAYLDAGLAAILVFIGAKFLLTGVVHIPVAISLLVIAGVMAVAIAASLRRAERRRPQPAPTTARRTAPRSPSRTSPRSACASASRSASARRRPAATRRDRS